MTDLHEPTTADLDKLDSLPHVYLVLHVWGGKSGADQQPIGIYADEFTAKRVARDYKLDSLDDGEDGEGQSVEVVRWPVLDVAEDLYSYLDSRYMDPAMGLVYRRT